jgi:hypothetical protein
LHAASRNKVLKINCIIRYSLLKFILCYHDALHRAISSLEIGSQETQKVQKSTIIMHHQQNTRQQHQHYHQQQQPQQHWQHPTSTRHQPHSHVRSASHTSYTSYGSELMDCDLNNDANSNAADFFSAPPPADTVTDSPSSEVYYEGVALQTALSAFGSVASAVASNTPNPKQLVNNMSSWRGKLAEVVAPSPQIRTEGESKPPMPPSGGGRGMVSGSGGMTVQMQSLSAQEVFGASTAREVFGAPPAQEVFGAPPAQEVFGAPLNEQSRGVSPSFHSYESPSWPMAPQRPIENVIDSTVVFPSTPSVDGASSAGGLE